MMKFLALCVLFGVASVQAIINGEAAPESPHNVHIEFSNQNSGHFGGGSLISALHVITCGSNIHNFQRWACSMGSQSRSNSQTIVSNAALAHPDYDPATRNNDIGLILLPTQVTFSAIIMPIALPPLNGEPTPYFNEEGQFLSFGPNNNIGGPAVEFLMRGFQRVLPDLECQATHQNLIPARSFCAIDNNRRSDICFGGQGAAFTVNHRGREILSGIASISTCGGSSSAIYSRVSFFRQWIFEFIQI